MNYIYSFEVTEKPFYLKIRFINGDQNVPYPTQDRVTMQVSASKDFSSYKAFNLRPD